MVLDELARQVFSFICHQDPGRSLVPGGAALAMCARCTGVYVGFALALPLTILVRGLGRRLGLWLHGIIVVQIAIFGFHLIPHDTRVATASGQLFAVGVIYLVLLAVRKQAPRQSQSKPIVWLLLRYLLSLGLIVGFLQVLLRAPWAWMSTALNVLGLLGLGLFWALAVRLLIIWVRDLLGRKRLSMVNIPDASIG